MAALTQQPPAQQNGASTHPFTCNTCGVAFRSSDLQRTHMQSDWHRYNLKRRVASLPHLDSTTFAEKVLANKKTQEAAATAASFSRRCDACAKTFYSDGAYANHLGSQKHRLLTARLNAKAGNETESLVDSTFSLGEPMENASTTTESTLHGEEVVDSRAEEEFEDVVERMKVSGLEDAAEDPLSARPSHPTPRTALHETNHPLSVANDETMADGEEYEHKADLNQCLFCNYLSPSLDLNLTHMSRQHGFFIPEREYLVDLEGLINYLSETIMVLRQCLYCRKTLHTSSGIQTHMRDRGHCMIAYSTEDEQLEVGDFYDFRSTYSDEGDTEGEDDVEGANGGVSLGPKRDIKTTTQNAAGEDVEMEDDDDEGWESDSTLSSVPTDEITSIPISQQHKQNKLNLHRHHSHTDPRPHKNTDGFHSHAHHTPTAVYHDEFELHLPSGRTAGHRSLRVYYRQNLHSHPTAEERIQQRLLEDSRHDSDDADDEEEDESTNTETDSRERGRQLAVSRANGGLGMIGVSDARKKEVRVREQRQLKQAARAENRARAVVERKGNFQKHFRDHLLQ